LWPTAEPGSLRIQKLNAAPAADAGPVFSPDASTLAFVSSSGGVHLLALSAGAAVPLAGSHTGDAHPAFSPDGATVAVVRPPSSVCLLPVSSASAAPRCLSTPAASAGLDWTRDGKHLVISIPSQPNGPHSLHLLDAAAGTLTPLSPAPPLGDRWPVVSPRGAALAFLRDGVYWIYELTGRPPSVRRTRKLDARGDGPPAWSHDSRFLYYTAQGRLWRIGFNATARPQRVADIEGAAGRVTVAGPARTLVFSRPAGAHSELFLLTGF
jgi:Tol biopolymer transport system component